jgi:DNA-binding response OmpR family regulator
MVSGNISQNEISRVKNSGADDYLVKPFDSAQLKAKVAGLFNWNRRQDDKR